MKSLYEAMIDPALFGATFAGPSFANWRTVAKILDALPLTEEELALYRKLTGRTAAPSAPFQEGYLVKPRRAGGTLFAAAVGVHAALQDYREKLGPGEIATVAMIASDRRQARTLLNYAKGLIADSPIIAAEVVNETQETISFAHRAALEVHTTSFRSTRGYSYAAVILDELAFFRDDLSANPDVELIRAVRPGLANLRGRLLGLSSPHSKRGHLFEMHRQHFGVDDSRVLVLQADHSILNPTIDPKIIEQAMREDPEAARSEWFGEFRSDVSQFLEDALIDAAVKDGRHALRCMPTVGYCAFVDPSGGRHDAMTMGIAHRADGDRLVLDHLEVKAPPFDPEDVVQEFAQVARGYGIRAVTGDRYAGEWVAASFGKFGLRYEPSAHDKSTIYTECLPLFAQRRVELLDHRKLIAQLRMLERRPRSGGRGDVVDHPPRAHDDIANAACGALWLASTKTVRPMLGRKRAEYAERDYGP